MVKGLDLFIDACKDFVDQYILIGGSACYLAFEEVGREFRATRDLDIVLCTETLTLAFTKALWNFIRGGEYDIQEKSTGKKQFYRFAKPRQQHYPFMLEFFSRSPAFLIDHPEQHLTPISVDQDVVSLSAILLDSEYYSWIQQGRIVIRGIPIVEPGHIIPLKARAWLDLKTRRAAGEIIDSKTIKKHKTDIFRLVSVISPEPIKDVPESIKSDLNRFLGAMKEVELDLNGVGLGNRDMDEILDYIKLKYGI